MIDIWWHAEPAWTAPRHRKPEPMPILAEPEFGHERIDAAALPQACSPAPRREAVVAHCASDVAVRYHVVPVGAQLPPWPGKPLYANAPADVHVPPGMVIMFSVAT